MKISEVEEEIVLTAQDIRFARFIHLAALTGIDPSNFAAWSSGNRGISEKNLEVLSERLSMAKSAVLEGLELRREDTAIARQVHQKFEQLIALMGSAA